MSSISFQTYDPARDQMVSADIHPAERVYIKTLLDRFAAAPLRSDLPVAQRRARYERLIPAHHYLTGIANDYQWWTAFTAVLAEHAEQTLLTPIPTTPIELMLNTALVAGSTPIEFIARFHAICELHGFVEADDRVWLSEIILLGLTTGILSAQAGWEAVVSLLVDGPGGAVAMESSAGHLVMADTSHRLPLSERWHQALDGLRAAGDRRISPDTFGSAGWGAGWSMFDLEAWLDKEWLDRQMQG